MNTSRHVRVLAGLGSVVLLAALAACGGDDDNPSAGGSPDDPVEGTVRTFTYDDSIDPTILDPFEEAYPDVQVETATFNSNAQAAAKIRGGFGTDVIEVCLDESSPLVDNDLLAPIDTSQIDGWDDMLPSIGWFQPGVTDWRSDAVSTSKRTVPPP